MPDPDPTLADRLDEWADDIANNAHVERGWLTPDQLADLCAAAVRLREQDAEIKYLRRKLAFIKGLVEDFSIALEDPTDG